MSIKNKIVRASLESIICDGCDHSSERTLSLEKYCIDLEDVGKYGLPAPGTQDYRYYWRNPLSSKDYCSKCVEEKKHFEGMNPNIENSVVIEIYQAFNCGLIENKNGKCGRCHGTGKILGKNMYGSHIKIGPSFKQRAYKSSFYRALLSKSKEKCIVLNSNNGFWIPLTYNVIPERLKSEEHAQLVGDIFLFEPSTKTPFPYVRAVPGTNLAPVLEEEYGDDIK